MRKLSAILLLVIFALYNLGHLAYVYWAPKQITKHWYERVVEEDDPRLTTLHFPMKLPPYTVDQEQFRPTDGLVEFNGKPYRMVFHKMAKDTLFVKVLPDHLSLKFHESVTDWVSAVNGQEDDATAPGQKQKAPPSLKEYLVGELYALEAIVNLFRRPDKVHLNKEDLLFQQVPCPPPQS